MIKHLKVRLIAVGLLYAISTASSHAQITNYNTSAQVIKAAYAPGLNVDGSGAAWAHLASSTLYMDTHIASLLTNNYLGVDIRYAWDYTNLYVLVAENTNYFTSAMAQEAPDQATYQSTFYLYDCIAFWIDLSNTCGLTNNGVQIVKDNADFQPWFGFSSAGVPNLSYARANNSANEDEAGLANARVFTSGTFDAHNRKIEAAIRWADVAADVASTNQPGGNIASNVGAGLTLGIEPLLINNYYDGQSFLNGTQYTVPSGTDTNSVDVQLISQTEDTSAQVMNAAYAPGLNVDGSGAAWAHLASSTLYMDTHIASLLTNNYLGVDIRYAWDYTNLYVLVAENTNYFTSAMAQEAPDQATYQSTFYLYDCIAFWIDLSNTCGLTNNGVQIVKDNADFQPWFGFSSAGVPNLSYARANNSANEDEAGLANARVFTSGTFDAHNRKIEAAIRWADVAADVASTNQPGGNIASNVGAGLTLGIEPLLINNYYDGQSFLNGTQYTVPSGTDTNSVDVQLISLTTPPKLTIHIENGQVVLRWLATALNYTLMKSPALGGAASWTGVGGVTVADVANPGMLKVSLPPSATGAYYRLRN